MFDIHDRASLPKYSRGNRLDVVIDTQHEPFRPQDAETFVQKLCGIRDVVENLKQANDIEPFRLKQSGAHEATHDMILYPRLSLIHSRSAGFDSTDRAVTSDQRFLQEKAVSAP